MPPTSSKLSRRDRGRSRERSPRKRVRTFSQSTKRSSTERLSASPRHSTPSRRSKTPRRRSAELSASGSPSGSTHSSKSRRSPRSRSHSLASSRSPSPKRPSASTRRSKPSHRSKTSRRRSPSSSMRSAKPQPGPRSRSRSPTGSRSPSVEPVPDFEAVGTARPTSARHSSPTPSPSISPTRRSKVDRRRHVSLRSPPSKGDDADPPRASSKRTREPRARQPELVFNGARLGSLMAHLSGGGSPPASVEALVSRVCDDRTCECRKEFDLAALLANHKEARLRLERLMRCSKFTLVDQATAIVLAGNRQETIDKFNMWNAKHQRAVSHFCRVEGVLRAVAAHVGAAHLLQPLDDSSPHGIRAPRTSRRRGPPQQQQQQPNPYGAHFPSLASTNGPTPSRHPAPFPMFPL